jgi:hypothetical protein
MRQREWHGMWGKPEYWVWALMIQRCHNPSAKYFPLYGGRGITVCNRWRTSFGTFFADMGARPAKGLSLDRIDNDGGYSPENCRWATRKEQMRNTRNNSYLTLNGETHLLCEWVEITGLNSSLISNRINRMGWSVEEALTIPVDSAKFRRGEDTLAHKARMAGLPDYIVQNRVYAGWTIEKALSTPVRKHR